MHLINISIMLNATSVSVDLSARCDVLYVLINITGKEQAFHYVVIASSGEERNMNYRHLRLWSNYVTGSV